MSRPNMIPCASCGLENNILSRKQEEEFNCFNCGADLQLAIQNYDKLHKNSIPTSEETIDNENQIKDYDNENQIKDYPALTFLSKATNLIAWLAVVMSIIWTLIYLSNVGQYASGAITFLTLIVTAIGAFMIFIFWKAISEVLIVLVDIAQDLRRIRIKE